MKAHNTTTSTIDAQAFALAPDARDKRTLRPLAERELEQVAAAGGKGGVNGGDVHHRK